MSFKQLNKYVEESYLVEYDYEADRVKGYYKNVTPSEVIEEERDELRKTVKKLEAKIKKLQNVNEKLNEVKAKEKADHKIAQAKALPGNRLDTVD